ncbi:MAG TPA: NfeD family protein [Sphingomonadaceae bacterium]|nr:NfeD family protein [Sphingomonadaceae bacterium]
MTPEDIAANSHWWWLIGGLVLLSAEMLVPGVYLVWLGVAALLTGVLAFVLPLPAELASFAALSVGATLVGRGWYRNRPVVTSDPLLNDRAAQLIGTVVTVVEAANDGRLRVKVGDGIWSARGQSAAGEQVRIIGYEGQTLIVEPLSTPA